MTATRLVVLLAVLAATVAAVIFCLDQAARADDTPPTTAPTPGPVVATGGGSGGTSPGSGCTMRLGLRNNPAPPSALTVWNQSGDSGWPFGYPGSPPWTPITAPPSVNCSR